MKLLHKYFPTKAQQVEQEAAVLRQVAVEREQVQAWLAAEYARKFEEWLKGQRRGVEPHVGNQNDMVYRVGLRDGIQLVLDRLDELKLFANERTENG